jgi:hypothetical protein
LTRKTWRVGRFDIICKEAIQALGLDILYHEIDQQPQITHLNPPSCGVQDVCIRYKPHAIPKKARKSNYILTEMYAVNVQCSQIINRQRGQDCRVYIPTSECILETYYTEADPAH